MLSDDEAADYCGFKTTRQFKSHVRVQAVNFGNYERWDRHKLDEWLDTLGQSQKFNEMALVEAAGTET